MRLFLAFFHLRTMSTPGAPRPSRSTRGCKKPTPYSIRSVRLQNRQREPRRVLKRKMLRKKLERKRSDLMKTSRRLVAKVAFRSETMRERKVVTDRRKGALSVITLTKKSKDSRTRGESRMASAETKTEATN